MPPRTRPIEKFAKTVAQCLAEVFGRTTLMLEIYVLTSSQASVYGKCIVADYNHVHKDKCLKEFLQLKDCFLVGKPVDIIRYIVYAHFILRRHQRNLEFCG